MTCGPLEEQYYFLESDYRYEDEKGHIQYPEIDLAKNCELQRWSNEPVKLSKAIEFISDKEPPESKNDFLQTNILSPIGGPILRGDTKELIMHMVPENAQWLPVVINTSYGELIENWWMLHIWKLWDCWDRKRSIREIDDDGEVFDSLEKIYLDAAKVVSIPEEERLIIRLEVFNDEYILFHEQLVKIFLNYETKGSLFVPLNLFSPGASWWYNNKEEINRFHPW